MTKNDPRPSAQSAFIRVPFQASLAAILTLSILLRVAAALYLGDIVVPLPGTADQVSYHTLALRVLNGHGFSFAVPWWPATAADAPTAHWSYLYTTYLVAVYKLFGPHPLAARLIQAILVGLLHPYLAYLIGRRAFNRPVGLIAAALTAIYAYFIYYAATLMTEPFYITATLAALYMTLRLAPSPRHPVTLSPCHLVTLSWALTLAAAVLLRQLFLLIIPFLFLWLWWARRRQGQPRPLREILLALVIIAGTILPFTLYNAARFDRFVLLNTNAGFALFWANHPIHGTHFQPILPPDGPSYHSLIPDDLRALDEAALDQALLQRGLQFIVDEPGRYLRLSLSRIPAYFIFWPSPNSSAISNLARVASFGLFLPFMLWGLLLAITRRQVATHPLTLLLLYSIIYTTTHLLSWALIRYRLPVDAVLLIFAALAFKHLYVNTLARWNLPTFQPSLPTPKR